PSATVAPVWASVPLTRTGPWVVRFPVGACGISMLSLIVSSMLSIAPEAANELNENVANVIANRTLSDALNWNLVIPMMSSLPFSRSHQREYLFCIYERVVRSLLRDSKITKTFFESQLQYVVTISIELPI